MSWTGFALGAYIGSRFGGALGALLGGVLGLFVEKAFGKKLKVRTRTSGDSSSSSSSSSGGNYRRTSARNREMVFCASAAAMLAKMAKADGHVTQTEINAVEVAFRRLGFSKLARDYAVNVFRKAKDDDHTIYDYAYEFASATPSVEIRELFYELLWDLAGADGDISFNELTILKKIPASLGINARWFDILRTTRWGGGRGQGARSSRSGSSNSYGRRSAPPPPRDELADAYAELDVSPSASDDEVKKAYRAKAKKYHPDALKAQGLPDEMIGKATERMARINAAWSKIKEARGI